MSRGFFITGTDTDVGKTTTALGLMAALQHRGLKVAAMKPVSAGCTQTREGLRNDDAVRLMQQASLQLPYELVNPYAFTAPIAPHIAAAQIGTRMEITPLVKAYQQIAMLADIVIVEGAGGWLVPLNETHTLGDLATALSIPVITVVGLRLGCLNHALLTQASIQAHGLKQAGWVANQLSPEMPFMSENLASLQQRIDAPLLGVVPYDIHQTGDNTARHLDVSSLT